MRLLLAIVLTASLPALAQPGGDGGLESLLAKAQEAQARGDFGSAETAYRQAVALRPDSPELWSNLAIMQYESHQYPQAEQALHRALGINKSLFVPNLFLGLDLLELKRPRDAVPYLLAVQKLNPQDSQTMLGLGRAFHMLHDAARSQHWFQAAAAVAPKNSEAWYGLGVAYFELAERASAKLATAFPKSPYVAKLAEDARSEHGLPPTSPEQLRQKYPDDAAGLYWQVRAYQNLGVNALVRAGELEPDSPKMHALLGDAYQREKMFRQAEDEYSRILGLDPNSLAGFAGLATAYLHDGQLDQAQANARKALDREPQDPEINLLMGEILVARHDYAAAEPYLRQSLKARPDLLPRVHALLGRVFARTGRPKEAIDELNQGLASDEDGSLYYQLARLYQSSGDTKAAAVAFQKSQLIRSKHEMPTDETLAPAH